MWNLAGGWTPWTDFTLIYYFPTQLPFCLKLLRTIWVTSEILCLMNKYLWFLFWEHKIEWKWSQQADWLTAGCDVIVFVLQDKDSSRATPTLLRRGSVPAIMETTRLPCGCTRYFRTWVTKAMWSFRGFTWHEPNQYLLSFLPDWW